jgi:hypothetical protein
MSLGKISNSLAAATIENSLSLFQFNFDFTFKKTAPPIEFHPVGQALSVNRRMALLIVLRESLDGCSSKLYLTRQGY